MRGDLVFDIGMCDGADTAYYLRLGFRVVAVEADPELCDAGRTRFADAIARGQLSIVPKAIVGDASAGDTVTLWVNPDNREWNTAAGAPAASRNATRRVEVPAVRLASLFGEFGVPLYLKVDIEGMDRVCAEAIEPSERPRFVSLELCDDEIVDVLAGKLDGTDERLDKISLKPRKTNIKVRTAVLAWTPLWVDGAGHRTDATQ